MFSYYWNDPSRVKGSGYPLYGALVGFDVTKYGHIAVAVGARRMATTVGVDPQREENTIQDWYSVPAYSANYRGWVLP